MSESEQHAKLARQARSTLLTSFIAFDLVLFFFVPNWLAYLYCLGGLGSLVALFSAVRALSLLRAHEIKAGKERRMIFIGLAFAIAAFLLAFYLMLNLLDAGLGLNA